MLPFLVLQERTPQSATGGIARMKHMHRAIVIGSIATLGLAAPLAAQGHSGKQTRTYVDARGRQCRETTHLKGNGDEKYEVTCKSAKGHKGFRHEENDDD